MIPAPGARLRIALLAAAGLALAAAAPAQTLDTVVEPGTLRADGSALVPFGLVEDSGRPFRVRDGELSVLVDGEAVSPRLVSFGAGEEPWMLTVLLDPSAFGGADARAWAEELIAILGAAEGNESIEILGVGSSRPLAVSGVAPNAPEIAGFLESGKETRLWDGTIRALDRISAAGGPARRVLLLVTDGEEGRASRLPVASVADAADSARVSIWTLAPRAGRPSEAGRARLANLARRTGGRAREVDRGRGAEALRDAVAALRSTQGVVLPAPASLPAQVVLQPGLASAGQAPGWIRERRRLGASGGFPGWLVPAVLVVVVGSAVLLLRRRLPIGRVVPRGGRPVTVTRAGLTLGGAVGNRLVLDDPRVSRNHAVIRMEGRTPVLVDLRSSNGTTLNGRRITRAELGDGDRIMLAEAIELRWERFRFGRRR